MRALILSLLLICSQAFAAQAPPLPLEQCKVQAPFGFPTAKKQNSTKICRSAYVLEHDNVAKIPIWASYVLKPKNAIGCDARNNSFAADRSLKPGERSNLKDFAKSGYDRGHLVNAADMRFSLHAQRESFILSNMAPQLLGFNRGIWSEMESLARAWAVDRKHDLLVYVGTIYDRKQDKRIGAGGVTVPNGFFKVLVDLKTFEVQAFIFDHTEDSGDPVQKFSSVPEVQRRTGLILPLPAKPVLSKEVWQRENLTAKSARKESCALK